MKANHLLHRSVAENLRVAFGRFAIACICFTLFACGGSADAPPPPETGPVLPVPPTITQQPSNVTVTAGQPASFSVAASGTAPLAYQWQRNGVAIAGATATTYTLTTVLGDSGATFRAVASNVAGSATSNSATLTVTVSAPVLTISPQPANTSVTVGATASFTVGGTCSSGTLDIQWQRSPASGQPFANIAGATATTYSFMTVMTDSGAQFRAVLDCSGQSSTPSNSATLTVAAPGSVTLSLLPLAGLRDQADITFAKGIDAQPDGTYVFVTANRIKRLSADRLTIDLLAGGAVAGTADGPAGTAQFNQPSGVTHDAVGNLYVADTGSNTIRRVASDGTVTTIAGSPNLSGTVDGTAAAARFNLPTSIALGPDGDLYVGDVGNNLIRRVTTAGVVTTYAGTAGGGGYLDGPPASAKFLGPVGIAVAANGDVLIADRFNHRVRRVTRVGATAGPVDTLAGSGVGVSPSVDGIGVAAIIVEPNSICIVGNIVTIRDGEGLVRQIDLTTRVVSTLTGSRALGAGVADGTSTVARLLSIGDITSLPGGGFVTVDIVGLRLVSPSGDVMTFASTAAGPQTPVSVGTLPQEPFRFDTGVSALAVDLAGSVVVLNGAIGKVRRIDNAGAVTLVAGLQFFAAIVDGVGSAAQFLGLNPSLVGTAGGVFYVGDRFTLRRIGSDDAVTTFAGSKTSPGGVDGSAMTALFQPLAGLAVGPNGDVFAADGGNAAVRRIDAMGNVTTYAGVLGQRAMVDGPIAAARFSAPAAVAFAPDGSLYVVDTDFGVASVIRKVAADGLSVSTVGAAGNTVALALTIDPAGNLYYFDSTGLRMLAAGASSSTLLIRSGNTSLGSNPSLDSVQSIAVLGPKELVLIDSSQLLVVTLP